MRTEQRTEAVRDVIAKYRVTNVTTALIHLTTTLMCFLAGLAIAVACLVDERPATIRVTGLIVAYLMCGLGLFKLFAIQHDCAHDSYWAHSHWNRALGRFCSLLTLFPFASWREEHLQHHRCFARIDEQAYEDIPLLTVAAFRSASAWRRICYRTSRSPIFLLVVAPLAYVLLRQRVPNVLARERVWSCASHNATIALIYGTLFYWYGSIVFWVMLPPWYLAMAPGVAIFLAQHQFENAEWMDAPGWRHDEAVVNSSSYLAMPALLEWLTGYLGYHHLHHFSPKIPLYHLKTCHRALGGSIRWRQISLSALPRIVTLALWSNERRKLVTFREARILSC